MIGCMHDDSIPPAHSPFPSTASRKREFGGGCGVEKTARNGPSSIVSDGRLQAWSLESVAWIRLDD